MINAVGQTNYICTRLIVVGQLAGNLFNAHIGDAIAAQDDAGSLCTGDSPARVHRGILGKRRVYVMLCPER